jgi:hypothetical protein
MADDMKTGSTAAVDEGTLGEILEREWEMFHDVRGLDGPAPCQQDRGTFDIMRASQLSSWNQETAESYLDDLQRAQQQGRNLMTEKYARMMESTSPCECRGVGAILPELDERTARLVEALTVMSVRRQEEVAVKYPYVARRGRPLRSQEDSRFVTSFETYTRGELATYSARTLQLLHEHYLAMAARGENPAEVILEHTVRSYGFDSLERAESATETHARRQGGRPE